MSEKEVPFTIYAETTPNPKTMKFVANKILVPYGATVEYNSELECQDAPLAKVLFTFPFVESLFFSSNFVSITKKDFIEWDDVVMEMREYLTNYLRADQPIFTKPPKTTGHETKNEDNQSEKIKVTSTPQNEMEEKIINLLEEYVRPAVEGDGGAIHFKSFDEGKVTVKLSGACSGCPSSTQTLKFGIENLFKEHLPEVQEVVAEDA
ncbi:NifU family protein [Salibacter sp.]|uniref:NifU family protein n=1 Tax=Salibacter sp. TaxID=2010995 RepID=UPI00287083BB|nr:NifU family protein [Salibacter sp.]MDR9487356.1 NifU family protein [Salibacter sp.]